MLIAKPDGTLATFLDISSKVDSTGERGLQAVTLDPKHSPNHGYFHYTKEATSCHPGPRRYRALHCQGDKVVAGGEKLVFRLDDQNAVFHMGGGIEFGNDEKLYVATADNFAPTNSQQLTNLFGKMLRITKSSSIPTDNPFYRTTSGKNRAIWALGLRNPYKFAIQPGAHHLHERRGGNTP